MALAQDLRDAVLQAAMQVKDVCSNFLYGTPRISQAFGD